MWTQFDNMRTVSLFPDLVLLEVRATLNRSKFPPTATRNYADFRADGTATEEEAK